MKTPASKLSRRHFLLAVSAGGAATAAAVAIKTPRQPKKAAAVTGSKGYHVTEHVRKYYSTTKV
jgi:hypothetical protein